MGELEEKLNTILRDPHAMEQIMSLARSLGGSSGSPAASAATAPAPPSAPVEEAAPAPLDPKLLSAAAKLMGEYNKEDDRRTALLQALRPFVKEKRYAKLDQAIQIARLSRMLRVGLELLRPKEDGDV